MANDDNIIRDIVNQPAWQRFLKGALLSLVPVGTVVFVAGTYYQEYRDLPTKVEKLADEIEAIKNLKPNPIPREDGAYEERIAALEKFRTDIEPLVAPRKPGTTAIVSSDEQDVTGKIDRGVETFAIMLNEDEAKKNKSGGFYLEYNLEARICDVNMKHMIVQSGDWQPNAGDILKLTIPAKRLESWCMVVGLYTSRKDTEDAQSVLLNVSRPVAEELAFKEPLDKRMVKVTVTRIQESEFTNEQIALRVKYGI